MAPVSGVSKGHLVEFQLQLSDMFDPSAAELDTPNFYQHVQRSLSLIFFGFLTMTKQNVLGSVLNELLVPGLF